MTLPAPLIQELHQIASFSSPSHYKIPWEVIFTQVRECFRRKHKVQFCYLDLKQQTTQRTIWPLALVSFSPVWLLAGWCELRQSFRNFRLDRISDFVRLDSPYSAEKDKNLSAYLAQVDHD